MSRVVAGLYFVLFALAFAKASPEELVISHRTKRGVRAFSLRKSLLNDKDYILKKINNRASVSQRKISGSAYKKLMAKIRDIEKKRKQKKAASTRCEQQFMIAKPLEGIRKQFCVTKGSSVEKRYSQLMFELNMQMLN